MCRHKSSIDLLFSLQETEVYFPNYTLKKAAYAEWRTWPLTLDLLGLLLQQLKQSPTGCMQLETGLWSYASSPMLVQSLKHTFIYTHTHTRHFKESDSWLSVHATKNTPSPQCTRCYSETTTPQINGSYKPDVLHCCSLNGWYSWWYNPHAAPRESPSSSLSLCFPRPPLGLMEQQRGLQATSTFQKRLLNRMWTIKGYLKQYEYISFKLWV